jgi:serine phosphatase RsbU (regulator of sigma subunit)
MKLRTALIATLSQVLLITILAIGATSHWSARSTAQDLSSQILEETCHRVEQDVAHLLEMAVTQSTITRDLIAAGRLDPHDQQALTAHFLAAMKANPGLTYLSFGLESNGDYCHVVRDPQKTLTMRFVRRIDDQRRDLADFRPGATQPHWTKPDHQVDARRRPYYTAAVKAGRQTWTQTYIFIGAAGTLDTPGVTCATPIYEGDKLLGVLTADFDFEGLSSALRQLSIGKHGQSRDGGLAFIIERRRPDKDDPLSPGRRNVVIAHPDPTLLIKRTDPLDPDQGSDWVPAEQIGDARVQAFLKHLSAEPVGTSSGAEITPVRFSVAGAGYLGGYKHLSANRPLDWVICVAIPESDVMAGVWLMNRITTGLGVASVAVAVLLALFLAKRISRPIEALVQQSDRIRKGDFEPGASIDSPVTEVRRLAAAHERMRIGLRSLVRIEHDLQIARRIQQNTLPDTLPPLGDFQIEAWNEPAAETGGDTYDMVTCRTTPSGDCDVSSVGSTQRAILLLADATGHGVGPALSVTQVRAMLRMAVRMGADLPRIARHMNEQLLADLPTGMFVTAWLGDLNASNHTLTTFSAGQAPLFYYDAMQERVQILGADCVPLGIIDDLDADSPEPLVMNKGDIFAVISDGVFEAFNADNEPFSIQRVADLIATEHRSTAAQILAALRQALTQFTADAPADDDRTVLMIKRNQGPR